MQLHSWLEAAVDANLCTIIMFGVQKDLLIAEYLDDLFFCLNYGDCFDCLIKFCFSNNITVVFVKVREMEDTEQMQRITEEKKVAVHEELIRKATAKKVFFIFFFPVYLDRFTLSLLSCSCIMAAGDTY